VSLPTPSRRYTIAKLAGAQIGSLTHNQRDILLQVKNALVSSGQWSVTRSCNGVAVATGDNWSVYTDIITGSWVQLTNTLTGWQWLIYVSVGGGGGWTEVQLYVSGAVGFTGGAPAVAPTASDSFRINTFGVFLGTGCTGDANPQYRAFVWTSNDGQITYVAWWYAGKLTAFWQVQAVASPVGGSWTPVMGVWFSSGNDPGASVVALNFQEFVNPARTELKAKTPAGVVEILTPTFEKGLNNWAIVDAYPQNEATLQYLWQSPVGLQVGAAAAPRNGTIGWLDDQWWGPAAAQPPGNAPAFANGTTGDDGRMIFVGQMILPWDGTQDPPHGGAATSDMADELFYGRDCGGCSCGPDDWDPDACGSETTPLGTLRRGAQELADKVDDQSVSVATWNLWVNQGKDDLWRRIVAATGDSAMETHDFTLAGGVGGNTFDVTTIPARDFGRLTMLEIDPDTQNRRRVRPFKFVDKNRLVGLGAALPLYDDSRRYRRKGNVIYVERFENAAGAYRVYYVPRVPDLVDPCDALPDILDEWSEYPQVFAAMKALGKEESDPGLLPTRLRELRDDIKLLKGEPDDDPDADGIADVEDMGGDGWD
jgi:hypothetical protein